MVSKVYLLWLVFLLGGGGWWWSHCDGCWDHEKTALLQLKPFFYSYIDGVNNWGEGPDCCEWEKVECNNSTRRIIRLFLNTFTTYWVVPKEQLQYLNVSLFLPFEELQSLYISGNSIAGFVGHQGFEKLSTKLDKLEILDLSYNHFNDTIFPFLSELSSLKFLNLAINQFTGSDPSNGIKRLSKLKNLKTLYLDQNKFGNSIISNLPNCTSLRSLSLQQCELNETVQILEFNNLMNLKDLDLSDNSIESLGSSFKGEMSLKKLEVLGLSYNQINNSIFSSLTSLSNLRSLDLRYNRLEGPIHIEEINALSSLEELYMSSNQVMNFVPSQGLCELPNLKKLDLGYNDLKVVLPECFSNLTSLQTLDLSFNHFSGNIFSLKNLTSLEMLDLSSNQFYGDIYALQRLTSLQSLDLSDNQFFGNISFLKSLTSLQTLKLSSNKFSGDISRLRSLTSLQMLDLSSNQFSGNISPLESQTSLQMLDLSSNQFSGNISPLESLTSLQELRLSNNNFQIPISLGPLFNLSMLKLIYADNNTVYAPITQMHYSLGAPSFQLQEMSLSCCGDVGSFPEFLYHQHDLEYLDLSNIFFKGKQFPGWLLENNTKLYWLVLANSSLSGPIQLPLASHMGLSHLDISNNFINGSIPVEMGAQLPSLQSLNMSINHFNGSIPLSFGNWTSLEILDLSNNQLSGGIPEHLTMTCPSLQVLALSNNKLEGRVFSENFNLPWLGELHLNGNSFSGEIPDVLSKCSSLLILDVSNNKLSGRIPRWMGKMSYLEKIIMSNNHLQGTIPVEFCQLDYLILLALSVNNISGSLPSCFGPSQQLTQLHLSKNRLRGTLPNALRNSSALVTLDISNNFFSGSIPSWIGGLSNLSYLLFSNNNFQGEIPKELCKLNHLSLINLSQNNLSGQIPHCLKVTTLENVSIDYGDDLIAPGGVVSGLVIFSWNEPLDFPIKNVSNSYKGKIIPLVSGIDLSCNKLVGEIPFEFGNLYKILVLNLSHNTLTGPIPSTFANLKQIESLDLSYNKLSGSIPPQLVGLNFLAYFVVSFNNLSGKTPPRSAQFGTFDESSYRGNPFLCGEPLPKCGDTGPPNPSTDGDEEDGLIDMGVFHVSFVVSYIVLLLTVVAVLYINPYWRRVWFYHAETTATSCYYFVLDNVIPRRFRC